MAIDIRALLANRLLTAPDTWERHLIVAQLVGAPPDLVDVGGLPGQLRSFLPRTHVTAVNVTEPADIIVPHGTLPFADGAYAAATSLDVLEHVPPADRSSFVRELVRVSRERTVMCCPLGSPDHSDAENEIQAWFRSVTGDDHPWLAEHIDNGLPSLDELRELLAAVAGRTTFMFHGDFRDVNRQFKQGVLARYRHRVSDVLGYLRFRVTYRPVTGLRETPTRWSNRVFVIVESH